MNEHVQRTSDFVPARRFALIGFSEILKITAIAGDLKRQGWDVIIPGAGEPVLTPLITSRTLQLGLYVEVPPSILPLTELPH